MNLSHHLDPPRDLYSRPDMPGVHTDHARTGDRYRVLICDATLARLIASWMESAYGAEINSTTHHVAAIIRSRGPVELSADDLTTLAAEATDAAHDLQETP